MTRSGSRRVRLALGVLLGLTMLAAAAGAAPALPERPTGLDAGIGWAQEPAAATLARLADRAPHTEQFYFARPDRFANGDRGNGRGGLPGDRMSTGYDPSDKGFYHGGDLRGVID